MLYRPEAVPTGDVAMEPVDSSKAALKWLKPPASSVKMYAGNFKSSSGTTRGEIELLETAPLIYPDTGYAEVVMARTLDPRTETAGKDNEAKRSVFSQNKKVAAAYFDKRAQARYVSIIIIIIINYLDPKLTSLSSHRRPTRIPTPPWRRRRHRSSPPDTATRRTRPSRRAMRVARQRPSNTRVWRIDRRGDGRRR